MKEGLSFNDVLLEPKYSDVRTRKQVSTKTCLTKKIELNIPLVSSNMDTVTEANMAINMAEQGGIGIIHRFLTIEQQIHEVAKVKRAHNYIIHEPYTALTNCSIEDVKRIMGDKDVGSLLVVDQHNRLKGVVSARDLIFADDESLSVDTVMTPLEKLVYKEIINDHIDVDFEEARNMLKEFRVEKLPIINKDGVVKGLITVRDIEKRMEFPNAVKDKQGRLLVGAAIGVKNDYFERTHELIKAGVDVLVIDIAHGHSKMVMDVLEKVKSEFPDKEIIAGNVATKQGTLDLISAGADAIKVGIGGGSTCITRIITGSGVPQLTAVLDCYEAAASKGVPIISDGGIKYSGDIVKALAGGASTVMLGSLLAGCEESTGLTRIKDGQKYKVFRGMASFDAAANRRNKEKGYDVNLDEYVPEGIETILPYKGLVREVVDQLMGGVRSGMSYLGVNNIPDMKEQATFIKISPSGWSESMPHALK